MKQISSTSASPGANSVNGQTQPPVGGARAAQRRAGRLRAAMLAKPVFFRNIRFAHATEADLSSWHEGGATSGLLAPLSKRRRSANLRRNGKNSTQDETEMEIFLATGWKRVRGSGNGTKQQSHQGHGHGKEEEHEENRDDEHGVDESPTVSPVSAGRARLSGSRIDVDALTTANTEAIAHPLHFESDMNAQWVSDCHAIVAQAETAANGPMPAAIWRRSLDRVVTRLRNAMTMPGDAGTIAAVKQQLVNAVGDVSLPRNASDLSERRQRANLLLPLIVLNGLGPASPSQLRRTGSRLQVLLGNACESPADATS